jgi:hypothetical protein
MIYFGFLTTPLRSLTNYSTTRQGWNCTGCYWSACASFCKWPDHSATWNAMSSSLWLTSTKKTVTSSRWEGRSRIYSKLELICPWNLFCWSIPTFRLESLSETVDRPGKFRRQQACFAFFGNGTQANIGVEVLNHQASRLHRLPLPRLTVKRYDYALANPQLVWTSKTFYSRYEYPQPLMMPITAPGKYHDSQPVDIEQAFQAFLYI